MDAQLSLVARLFPSRVFMPLQDELRAAFSAKTKAILINTPHNPTGKVRRCRCGVCRAASCI